MTSVEEMGLPEGVEDEKGLILVRCKTCARVLLAGSCAAHEEHCRAPPAPFRPAASPGPSSTTASVPASSGPASISQACSCPSAAVIRSSHYFLGLVYLLIDHGSIASELLTLQSKGRS